MLPESAKSETHPLEIGRAARFFSYATFSTYSHIALVLYALSAALSIALSQLIISSLLIYWILCAVFNFRYPALNTSNSDERSRAAIQWRQGPAVLLTPMLCWVLVSLTSTLIGINPLHSLLEIFKTSFYLLIPFCAYCALSWQPLHEGELLRRIRTYLIALLAGQAFAALHTIINTGFHDIIHISPPGPVTESGQAVLSLAAAIGLTFLGVRAKSAIHNGLSANWIWEIAMPVAVATGAVLIAWAEQLFAAGSRTFVIGSQIIGIALFALFSPRVGRNFYKWVRRPLLFRSVDSHEFRTILMFLSSLVFSAFIINLKRGPWLGFLSVCLIVGFVLSRRLAISALLLAVLIVGGLEPVRDRILHLATDFAISGGRQNMWALGSELVQRYPLGLGINNASVIRQLDPSLPEQHRHMHNNLLNVAAESGLIGVLIFIWWMVSIIQLGFFGWNLYRNSENRHHRQRGILCVTLASGIAGWQIAGIVEYNFGDGEVCMIALLLMGLITAAASAPTLIRKPTTIRTNSTTAV